MTKKLKTMQRLEPVILKLRIVKTGDRKIMYIPPAAIPQVETLKGNITVTINNIVRFKALIAKSGERRLITIPLAMWTMVEELESEVMVTIE